MLLRTVILVGLGLILIGAAAWDVGNPTVCERADDLAEDNRLTQAHAEYAKLLRGEPSADCAEEGLKSTVFAQCAAARKLREAGREEEATKAYMALVTKEPMPRGIYCGYAGLAASCQAADRLFDNGLLEAAHKAYADLAAKDASRGCASTGLRNVHTKRCAAARDLLAAGRAEAAEKAFATIAAGDPIGSMKECTGA